ncbi:serine hydrolase domain-containing protein [Arthrobacter sulfonylureivorans]|uniref:Beta-lactamase family protein n=1 Tax=Arthrobacter sulfonylureivorans TaxID=2486855 RepID=A0ABY3W8W6_9MICC|nr:serine hydrolase domain-containing protein [Arthrobacter sulfonylureivorans]UNK45573.1 beta-lactamase family protein [Arthrobacter sulfonylureivorans]
MSGLKDVLEPQVNGAALPGVVALVASADRLEVEALGTSDVEGVSPMSRDSIFRIASVTKPITAAAVLMLVDDGRLRLEDPVARWLPELESPQVVRTPQGNVDDVVPAARAITVHDVLSSRAGYGFAPDFSLPAVALLFSELHQGPPQPQQVAAPDDWMTALARIPLLHQPGEAWLYNTCSDIQGVLVSRVSGSSFPEFLTERLFEPLRMADTGFEVPAAKLGRFTSYYQPRQDGGLELVDAPGGEWSSAPAFPSGAAGLVSTADDLLAFGRMLLAGGYAGGRRLLSAESVRQMTTDQLTAAQRAAGTLFLEGQGWGYGGSVDVAAIDTWNSPGRYGWSGGTGTAAHVVPATQTVTILLSQVEMTSPSPPAMMRDFWRYAAAA